MNFFEFLWVKCLEFILFISHTSFIGTGTLKLSDLLFEPLLCYILFWITWHLLHCRSEERTQIIVSICTQYKIFSCHPVCTNLLQQPQETNILTKKKKRNERRGIATDLAKIKNITRKILWITWCHKSENLDESYKFLKRHKLLNWLNTK